MFPASGCAGSAVPKLQFGKVCTQTSQTPRRRYRQIVCVSSDEQVNLPATALFDDNENDANPVVSGGRNGRKRLTMGSLPTVTAIFGLTIAGEIIKNISRRADSER